MSPEGDHPRFPEIIEGKHDSLPESAFLFAGTIEAAKGERHDALSSKDRHPRRSSFDGDACSLTVRTVSGDVGILAGHLDLVSALGMGRRW